MAKILFVIAQDNFRDEEYREPREIFEKSGHDVTVASLTTEICKGKLGMKVKPDIAIKDVDVQAFDAVVLAGGGGSVELGEHEEALQLFRDAQQQGKVIACICISGVVLAKAGVLKGKKATVYHKSPEGPQAYQKYGVEFVDNDVVVDGKIVTASGPEVAKEFGRKILQVLI